MDGSVEKLTISEFAARAGCTTQRIYQLLQNSLQPFAIVENGRKYILSDGLQVVLEARKKQGFAKSSETLANPLQTLASAEKVDGLTAELDETHAELDAVIDQLREAEQAAAVAAAERDAERKRADDLRAQLDAVNGLLQSEQKHAAELLKALSSSQLLQAGQMQLAMTADQSDQTSTETGAGSDADEEKPAKRGFFARIFKRK